MLLKRQEKNGKIKAMYSSSTICASIFEVATRDLTIIFKNGGQYKYPSVDLTDYTRLETSDSSGTIFNNYIKKKYLTFEKLDSIAQTVMVEILKEIDELKGDEDKATIEGRSKVLVEAMHQLVGGYITNGNLDAALLEKLSTKLAEYNSLIQPSIVN